MSSTEDRAPLRAKRILFKIRQDSQLKGHGAGSNRRPSSVPPIPVDVDKQPVSLMKLAAKLSLDTGTYVDTRFVMFSRRKPSGVVFAPRAVFANSWLLRARLSTYFEPLLRGGYLGDSTVGPLDAVPDGFPGESATYDYSDDSDIDDDDGDGDDDKHHTLEQPLNNAECSKLEPSGSNVKVEVARSTNSTGSGLGTTGQTVMMKNHAYATWKAFIYYLYTGDIVFKPLKSQMKTQPSADATRPQLLALSAPPCSPKSMYRLADELGFEELKQKARTDISGKLTADNILDELFSTLSCRYDAIRDLEVVYACNGARHVIVSQFPSYIASMEADELKRCSETISLLVTRLAQR